MGMSGAANKNKKKRVSSDELIHQDHETKRLCCPSFPTGYEAGFPTLVKHFIALFLPQILPLVVERFFAEIWPQIQHSFRQQVREEIKSMIQFQSHSLSPSLSNKDELGKDIATGSGTLKLKLRFCNPIASIIFSNNEIKAENGEPLKIVICDATNSNAIISTGPLSSAPIEFFILDGNFDSGQQQDEPSWSLSDFNKSILSSRNEKRPLIVGRDLKLRLKNGVGFIKNLIVKDNSSWMGSRKCFLGAKITDDEILAEVPRVLEAVSLSFRIMDSRSEANKKHCRPNREDEVWRLKGIAKNGTYHKNLSSEGINTVGDFLKAYHERGPTTLKMLMGTRVCQKNWNMLVKNAMESVDVPTYDQTFETNVREEASNKNFEVFDQQNLGDSDELPNEEWLSMINFEVLSPSSFPPGEGSSNPHEVDYTRSHTQYYEGRLGS